MREHADRPALGSPGVNLFDRIFDGSSGCHDERFESSGVRAAVIVQEPMIRLDKAHLYSRIFVLVGPRRNHQMHVSALFIHVTKTDLRVLIGAFGWEP